MTQLDVRAVGVADLALDEVMALYAAVGWTAYTRDPDQLLAALRGSSLVVAAFLDGRLVGLARTVSDDATIAYVQDVLVDPAAQRRGVGRRLLRVVGERYAHVRQHVLLTDDESGQRAFYESLGFAETRDFGEGRLRAFVRFT